MSVRCLKCNYVMSTNQEVQSLVGKIIGGIWDVMKDQKPQTNLVAGSLNSSAFGEPVQCPKCQTKGQWEDS